MSDQIGGLTGVLIWTTPERFRAVRDFYVETLGLTPRHYGVVTLHRPSNVDDPATLIELVKTLRSFSEELPLVFAVHPRTRASAERAGIGALLEPGQAKFICIGPQPYIENLSLVSEAAVVFTDSGGLQEETSVLGVPCITMRENT